MSDEKKAVETFGSFLMALRLKKLREEKDSSMSVFSFPKLLEIPCVVYSDMETSYVLPPQNKEFLALILEKLGVAADSAEGVKFYALAARDCETPPEIDRSPGIPVFTTDVNGQALSDERFGKLCDFLTNWINRPQVAFEDVIVFE